MREGEWGWCHILHAGRKEQSYRSHRVRLEDNKYVRKLCEAAEKFTWVEVGNKKEDGTRTRIKFDVPGGSKLQTRHLRVRLRAAGVVSCLGSV